MGYSGEQAHAILNYKEEFTKAFKAHSLLDETELGNIGYTAEQVNILKTFSGTDAEMQALAATCTITLNIDYVTYSSSTGRTKSRFDYTFRWGSVPAFGMTDMVAVGWNDYWGVTGHTGSITYKHINSGATKYQSPTYKAEGGAGVSHKFSCKIEDNYYYASQGTGIFVVEITGRKDLHVKASYGHKQIIVGTPGVTIGFGVSGVSGGISISFTGGLSKVAEDYTYKFVS